MHRKMHRRLSISLKKNMKLAKFVHLLAVGLVLSVAAVGCKKGLDKTTQIPGQGAPKFGGESPSPIREPGTGGVLPPVTPGGEGTGVVGTTDPNAIKGPGIEQTDNLDLWIPNAEVFKDQTVYFDFDKSNVKASEIGKLEEVARRMKSEFQGKALRIEGHCDERGTEEYNRALGDRRALSVREKLVQLGVTTQIATITFGEEKPVDPGHNDAAWTKNRRGEIILLSPPGSN